VKERFYSKNSTIENTASEVGQTVALSVNATRVFFENCAFSGFSGYGYTSGEGFKQ
jgi:hypothetical protein